MIQNKQMASVSMPPTYPHAHPQLLTFPIDSVFANSGKNAAMSDSPTLKDTLEMTIQKIAQAISPGPDQPSAEVPTTQVIVLTNSARFFMA
jgi:hypothetical protein